MLLSIIFGVESLCFILPIESVFLVAVEQNHVYGYDKGHPFTEITGYGYFDEAVSNTIKAPIYVPKEGTVSPANIFCKVFQEFAYRSHIEV